MITKNYNLKIDIVPSRIWIKLLCYSLDLGSTPSSFFDVILLEQTIVYGTPL